MGTSLIIAKMPDNSLRFGNYQNTSDTAFSKLFSSIEDRDKALEKYSKTKKTSHFNCEKEPHCENDTVDVEIFCDYGDGFHWTAKADKKGTCIVDRLTPSGGTVSFGYWPEEDENHWECVFEIPRWVKTYYQDTGLPSLNPSLHP